jgi:hypothetical protein
MIKYEDIVTNATGTFPDTVAQNVSVPGAGDGTEFVAATVDDTWGFHQALMDYAGLTPDAVTEAPGTSQMLEALKLCFGHPGEVVMWHGVEDPNTEYGCRLLPLEGQCVEVADYADLLAAVYVGNGNNATYPSYYRCDNSDGSVRNTAGAYLCLADMRGVFPRGYDATGENDPEGATRMFPGGISGEELNQYDTLQKHIHAITCDDEFAVSTHLTEIPTGIENLIFRRGSGGDYELIADTITGAATSADETRPINVQVKFCIRY